MKHLLPVRQSPWPSKPWRSGLGIGGLLILSFLAACSASTSTPTPSPSAPPSSAALVGGDRDAHGCIPSAGYTWCEGKQKCLRPWEEECFASPYEAILWDLSRKYANTQKSITVTMVSQTEKHARARVTFGGPGTPGGMVLASKMTGIWRIVYEGNGNADCPALIKEEFPADMLKGFCDEAR